MHQIVNRFCSCGGRGSAFALDGYTDDGGHVVRFGFEMRPVARPDGLIDLLFSTKIEISHIPKQTVRFER